MTIKQFKPMLAETMTDVAALRFPLFVSPKLDGVRCVVRNGVALSRKLKPIPNAHVQALYGRAEFEGLDGELIVGDWTAASVFRDTTSGVMSEDGAPAVSLCVFDCASEPELPFYRRYMEAAAIATEYGDRLRLVEHVQLDNARQLMAFESKCVAQGFEGAMLRSMEGPYKYGRSTLREGYLLKMKRFADSEAEIIGAEELMRNDNTQTRDALGRAKRSSHKENLKGRGTLGALLVRDIVSGVQFAIGSGFDSDTRAELWALHRAGALAGRLVRYKFQSAGVKDKPRFPTYQGFRNIRDL